MKNILILSINCGRFGRQRKDRSFPAICSCLLPRVPVCLYRDAVLLERRKSGWISTRAPLLEKLVQHTRANFVRAHVPGHKGRGGDGLEGQAGLSQVMQIDWTEVPGLDNLHDPQWVIREAEELASACFGADVTRFLVGGSTAGESGGCARFVPTRRYFDRTARFPPIGAERNCASRGKSGLFAGVDRPCERTAITRPHRTYCGGPGALPGSQRRFFNVSELLRYRWKLARGGKRRTYLREAAHRGRSARRSLRISPGFAAVCPVLRSGSRHSIDT